MPRTIVRGFTLIETVIYLMIMGSILASALAIMSIVFEDRARVEGRLLVQENISFALRRIRAHTQQASDVTVPLLGQPTSTLILTMSDVSLQPTIVTLQNGSLMMQRGNQSALPLTSRETVVTSVVFTRLTGTPPMIQVQIRAQTRQSTSTTPSQTVIETFGPRR